MSSMFVHLLINLTADRLIVWVGECVCLLFSVRGCVFLNLCHNTHMHIRTHSLHMLVQEGSG